MIFSLLLISSSSESKVNVTDDGHRDSWHWWFPFDESESLWWSLLSPSPTVTKLTIRLLLFIYRWKVHFFLLLLLLLLLLLAFARCWLVIEVVSILPVNTRPPYLGRIQIQERQKRKKGSLYVSLQYCSVSWTMLCFALGAEGSHIPVLWRWRILLPTHPTLETSKTKNKMNAQHSKFKKPSNNQ